MRLAAICAGGGSTGVKDKNIRPLAGKPLIAHTIEQARRSGLFETIAVSSDTSHRAPSTLPSLSCRPCSTD